MQHSTPQFNLTLFKSDNPFSKQYYCHSDGSLKQQGGKGFYSGTATQIEVSNIEELLNEVSNTTSKNAISMGVTKHKTVNVVPKEKLANRPSGSFVSRTRVCFGFPTDGGVCYLDIDHAYNTPEEVATVLREAFPGLESVDLIVRASTGSCIVDNDSGEMLKGTSGWHVLFLIDDASHILDIVELIFNRMWLNEKGHIIISAAGSILVRTPVDLATAKPEHLFYCAAETGEGLSQQRHEPVISYGTGDGDGVLHTESITHLTDDEETEVKRLIAEAKSDPDTIARANAAKRKKAVEMAGEGASEEDIRAIQDQINGGVLPEETKLIFKDGRTITVNDALENPDEFDGKELCDPLEPDYRNDNRIAVLYCNPQTGRPIIHSHAHGGSRYELISDDKWTEMVTDELGNVPKERSRFDPVSAEEYAQNAVFYWWVKGLLPMAELVWVVGASGAGKSFWLLYLLYHISIGKPWRGIKTKKAKIVYIIAEGKNGFKLRLQALARHFCIPLSKIPIKVIPACPDLGSKKDVSDLIKSIGEADIVVVDTLAQTTPGIEENSSQMGVPMKHCKTINEETGATLIVVHHLGKDHSKGARGWSGLKAGGETEIIINRNGEDRFADLSKMRDGKDSGVYPFKLNQILLSYDEDGDEVTSCTVEQIDDQDEFNLPTYHPKGDVQRHVCDAFISHWDILTETPVCRGAIIEDAINRIVKPDGRDTRKQNVTRALDGLCTDGVFAGGKQLTPLVEIQ